MSEKRLYCADCQRPANMCFCDLVVAIPNEQRVVIIQHPLEAGHSKSTGLLLHRCLRNSVLICAEQLASDALARACGGLMPVLLYPHAAGSERYLVTQTRSAACALVVLDASWRKSRKMLHLNPTLSALPRLSLDATFQSRYLIRKAHLPEQRSSLEATCAALALLEPHTTELAKILASMDTFVARIKHWQPN